MTRLALNPRRHSERIKFQHETARFKFRTYYCTFSRACGLTHGPVVEIFLQGGRAGSEIEAMARDGAVLASLALQYGAPLQVLRDAMTRTDDGRPSGAMAAALDEIAKMIAEESA